MAANAQKAFNSWLSKNQPPQNKTPQELHAAIERLQNGVEKIAQASAQVADLQAALKQEQVGGCLGGWAAGCVG